MDILVAIKFWEEVLRRFPNDKVITLSKKQWQKLRKELLAPELNLYGFLQTFIRNFWITFIEKEANKDAYIAFVPEISKFIRTGKVPPRIYGSNYILESSVGYFDCCLMDWEKKRKKILESRRRQVRRDKWKSQK